MLLVCAVALVGCASSPQTRARLGGLNQQWWGFSLIQGEPFDRYEAVIELKIILVDDVGKIPYAGPGSVGAYQAPGTIWMVGKKVGGKFVGCDAVLGHEVHHALDYQTGAFHNPDRLRELGL